MAGNSNQKGTQALKSRVELDGLMRKLPGGYKTGQYMGDQEPMMTINGTYVASNLTGGQATLTASAFLVPCDYLAVAAYLNLVTAVTVAPATISIGIIGTLGAILNAYSIATSQATGFLDLTANAAFTGAAQFPTASSIGGGNQGDVIQFSTNGGGTAGDGIWGCILVPNG